MLELGYPCPEDVTQMDKTSCGHFCTTCTKEIMDFRGKTNEETKQILEDNPSISCGIFRPDQMKHQTVDHVSSLFRIAFAAIFIFGFNMNILFAQSCGNTEPEDQTIKIEQFESDSLRIQGRVFGIDKEELAGAFVYYNYNNQQFQTFCDDNAYFDIEIAEGIAGEELTLFVTFPGMESETVQLEVIDRKSYVLSVQLTEREYLRGKVALPGMIKRN